MKRNDFKKVIKIFSFWKIDKRKGNYKLPSGEYLSHYLEDFIQDFLNRNNLAIRENGDIAEIIDNRIFIPFGEDEELNTGEQIDRIEKLVRGLLY